MFILCSSYILVSQHQVLSQMTVWISNLEEKFGGIRNVELRDRSFVFAGATFKRLFFL